MCFFVVVVDVVPWSDDVPVVPVVELLPVWPAPTLPVVPVWPDVLCELGVL